MAEEHARAAPFQRFEPVQRSQHRRAVVHVSRQAGVKLRSKVFAFALDGIAVAPLLKDIDRPVPAMEVIRRWSRSIPVAKAVQLFDWAINSGLLE